MQLLSGDRLGEPQLIRVQGGAGDEIFILCAVEPVAREGVAEICHVHAELMRAPCLRAHTQECEALACLQRFVFRQARQAVCTHAAADDGALRAADGGVDDAVIGGHPADGNGAVFAP